MKKSVKILIIVLCLIIVGLVAFIIVDKVVNKDKDEEIKNEENSTVVAENEVESTENTTNNLVEENGINSTNENSNKSLAKSTEVNGQSSSSNTSYKNENTENAKNNKIENTTNNNTNSTTENTNKYSKEELEQMALDYYEKTTGYRPGCVESEIRDDGKLAIHLYDDFEDHIATSAWYSIDMQTGKGTDMFEENEIDLTIVNQ